MKSRSGVLLSCATGALLIGMAPVMPSALAADADILVKAAAPVEAPWWTHGFVEVGGRGFLNDPQRGGHIFQGGQSLAKFYEYRDLRPGPFGDFNVVAGSKDGLYEIGAWGQNVGYNDQGYNADVFEGRRAVFQLQLGSDPLRLLDQRQYVVQYQRKRADAGQSEYRRPDVCCGRPVPGFPPIGAGVVSANNLAKLGAISTIINQNVHPTDVGIRRDTASVDYRYTPTDNWDLRANYSNLRRTWEPGRRRAFHGHKQRFSCRCRQAGRRYNAELRRERRVLGYVRLGPEVQRDDRL